GVAVRRGCAAVAPCASLLAVGGVMAVWNGVTPMQRGTLLRRERRHRKRRMREEQYVDMEIPGYAPARVSRHMGRRSHQVVFAYAASTTRRLHADAIRVEHQQSDPHCYPATDAPARKMKAPMLVTVRARFPRFQRFSKRWRAILRWYSVSIGALSSS